MASPTAVDPATALALLLASAVSAEAAGVLGQYGVIFIGALLGSGWALSRRDPAARVSALWFVVLLVGSTTLCTAGLAQLASYYLPRDVGQQWLLGPIATVVAGIGHEWPAVMRWALGLLAGVVQRRANGTTNPPNPTQGDQQ